MTSKYSGRLCRCGCAVLALGLGASSVLGGGVAPSAYFSVEGDINAVGDQYNFNVGLTRSVSSAEDLRFVTWQSGGGTNVAGDPISFGGIDSFLELFDSLNNSRGLNDDHVTLDSLLTWAPIQTRGIALNPDPLVSGNYRLNLQEFSNNQTGPFAVDLIGPDDAMVFTGGSPVNGATLDSLKFGSNGGGNAVYNHSAGTFSLLGQLVVAQTGNAELNLSGGTITVGGLATVKAGGAVNQSSTSTFNANGGLTIDGGSYIRSAGTYSNPGILTVQNGGLFQWDGASNLFNVNLGSSVQVTGAGSTLRRRDPSPLADNTLYIQNNTPYNVTLGGKLDAEYLWLRLGTVNVDGAGSVLDMSGGDSAGYDHEIGDITGVSTLTLSNDATGTFDSTLATTLRLGTGGGSTGNVNVLSGADLTLQSLDMDESGTSTLTIDGAGSTVTQTAGSALILGSASGSAGTINIENAGVYNASHTGALNVNATGTLNVNSGGFFNVIPPNAGINVIGAAGGTLNSAGAVNVDTGTLQVIGGLGGDGNFFTFEGATGGLGGTVVVTGSAFTVAGDGVVSVNGGRGGDPGYFANGGGNGGMGGLFMVNGGSVVLGQNALLSARGGNGGTGGQTAVSGSGGTGGEVRVTSGLLTLNSGNITTEGGNPGAVGLGGSSGSKGANGLIDVTGGSFVMNGGEVFTGSFARSGAGVFNFNDGKLTVSGGSFNPGAANYTINGSVAAQLPTLVLTDGALATGLTGNMIVGQDNRGRLEVINSNSSVQAGNYFVLGQNIGSEGTLEVHAGGMVGSSNRFVVGDGGTGTANIGAGGQLVASNDLDLGAIGTGTLNADGSGALVTVAGNLYAGGWIGGDGGTGELNINNDATVDVANTLRVFDGGTVYFSGGMLTADTIDHTHGGAFNFTGGTLHVDTFNGTLDQNGGTLAPGTSPGKTVISSDYNQNSGVLEIELGGTVQTSEYDFVEVLGLASLNGDLVVSAINGFNPTYGDSFDLLMAWGGLIDAFNSVSFPTNPANSAWSLTNDGNFLRLSLDSTLAGDLDNDGFVGISDLNLVLGAWNLTVPPANAAADPSGDDFVGIEDLNTVLGNWNAGTPPPPVVAIPEPGTLALLGLACSLMARRRP